MKNTTTIIRKQYGVLITSYHAQLRRRLRIESNIRNGSGDVIDNLQTQCEALEAEHNAWKRVEEIQPSFLYLTN